MRREQCDIATVETSEPSTLGVDTRRTSILAGENICLVSAADTCPVSTADTCPVSTEDIYPVSTEDGTVAGLRPAAVMCFVETG